jgi:integrase
MSGRAGERTRTARDGARLRPLRFHDLRHTCGSLLAAAGVDLVTIQSAMGHAALATTSRYLHARPANEQAEIFTRAFSSEVEPPASETSRVPADLAAPSRPARTTP